MTNNTLVADIKCQVKPYWSGVDTAMPPADNFSSDVLINPQEGWTLKMPRSEGYAQTNGIRHEERTLDVLAERLRTPLKIPRTLESGIDPPYMINSYIPGRVVDACTYIDQTTPDQRKTAGHVLGSFIYDLGNAVPEHVYVQEGLDVYPRRFYRLGQLTPYLNGRGSPTTCRPLNDILEMFVDYKQTILPRKTDTFLFGHHDLHLGNLILDADLSNIKGVIDFGTAGASTVEEEMRFLPGIDPAMGNACIEAFEALSHTTVSRKRLLLWATAEYALRLKVMLAAPRPPRPAHYALAKMALANLCPGMDWDEADTLLPA